MNEAIRLLFAEYSCATSFEIAHAVGCSVWNVKSALGLEAVSKRDAIENGVRLRNPMIDLTHVRIMRKRLNERAKEAA